MGRGVGIENADVKVDLCSFKSTSPEAIGSNVETCTILGVRRGTCENFPGTVADPGGVRGFRQYPPFGMDLVLRTTDDRLSGTPLSG